MSDPTSIPTPATTAFWAPQAWVDGRWQHGVLLQADARGHWCGVTAHTRSEQHPGAQRLDGPVLPGVVNAHSHAFQRAIAGLTETCATGASVGEDFWSWRTRMYSAALRITPEQLRSIATQLYARLAQAGYTQVCEFHYLHHDLDGMPYARPEDMSLALVQAAQDVGLGLTLLPTLYMHAGFGPQALGEDQRRFAGTPQMLMDMVQALQRHSAAMPRVRVGLALHSLRAVDAGALREMAAYAEQGQLPVHIHIAEQTGEVNDCLSHTGARPVAHLLELGVVDARWNLVHATHTTPSELQGVADAGASIVICPSTEANLGDGVFDLPRYAGLLGRWSIGSDSHVTRCWSEELRLLEYSQRLTRRQRNVAAQAAVCSASASALFEGALGGGSGAAGLPLGGLAVGQRADFQVLDRGSDALLGVPDAQVLDAQVFSSPDALPAQVFVAGQPIPRDRADIWARDYAGVMAALWGESEAR
ncbi:MAG: formimidoylglutamate deiminase [Rhodoferax sp.]